MTANSSLVPATALWISFATSMPRRRDREGRKGMKDSIEIEGGERITSL